MNTLHDVEHAAPLKPPSLWFWVKAGLGFGAGFFTVGFFFVVIYSVLSLSFLAAVLRSMTHR